MLKKIAVVIFFTLLHLIALNGFADTPLFFIEISPRSGAVGDRFLMNVVVQGHRDSGKPVLTGGDDFEVRYIGPRNDVRILNGEVSSRSTHSYQLVPKKSGELLAPGAEVEIDGQKYAAPPLKIVIKEAGMAEKPAAADKEISLVQSVGKASLYEGEQTINKLELFYTTKLLQPQLEDLSYEDFWNQPLEEEHPTRQTVNGTAYSVLRIRRAIFPQRTGTLTLPSRKIQARVSVRFKRRLGLDDLDPFNDGLFSGFFDTTTYEDKVVRSNTVAVEVKPLPPAPAGSDVWSMPAAVVGKTELNVQLQAGSIEAGTAKTLSVEVSSFGNLTGLNEVPLQLPGHVRIYPETPETRYSEVKGLLLTKKTFRVTLVPLSGGTVTIPALKFTYFDPQSESWKNATTAPLSFEVSGAKTDQTTARAGTGAPARPESAESIAAPAPREKLPAPEALEREEAPLPPYEEPGLVQRLSEQLSAGFVLLCIALIGLIVWAVLRLSQGDTAKREAQKLLTRVAEASTLDDLQEPVFKLLRSELHEGEDLQGESLKTIIKKNVADKGLQFSLLSLIDKMDAARFGPAANSAALLPELKQAAQTALAALLAA